ncbi:hypothetical protein Q5P01_000326 [Channa striata]|uniref:Uncharacterized protein n=1 Tax=Channa striata TaxID=64152 RepID=A0AA88LMG9_CHASR|nr:hypothetical protein Q5P01_000326 [Channa striata]
MASARARRTKRAESPRGDNVDCKRTPGEPVSRAETPDQRVAFAGLKPLIPEDKMYSYKPSVISAALDSVLAKVYPIEARTKIKDSMPTTALVTCKLVHACAPPNSTSWNLGAKAPGEWRKEFESALIRFTGRVLRRYTELLKKIAALCESARLRGNACHRFRRGTEEGEGPRVAAGDDPAEGAASRRASRSDKRSCDEEHATDATPPLIHCTEIPTTNRRRSTPGLLLSSAGHMR